MKRKLVLGSSVALLLVIVALFSCNKNADAPVATTTVAQDKAFITEVTNNTNNCIKAARDGSLAQSIIKFLNVSNGVAGNENWADSMSTALENVMGTLELDPNNSKFNYQSYWGTYTYNRTTKTFSKVAATGIFINIPSEPAQTTNNVVIKLTEYTDGLYQANAKDIYLPKTAKGSVTKDNVIIAEMDFAASYSSGSFPAPINMSYRILLAPHTYQFNVQRITNTQFNFTSNIFSGGGCGMSINATVSFNNDDYNNFRIEDDLKTVNAQYQSGDFIVKSNFDAVTYYALSNPTTANLNASLTNEVYNKTVKIGDLKFTDVAGQRKLFIYYKDGSSENTSVYYDPFLTNLKNTLRPIFGNDVDNWF